MKVQRIILLATDDSAVEIAVQTAGASTLCTLNCAHTGPDAVSMLIDHGSEEALAVVDLDLPQGGRTLLRTASGTLPVHAPTA